MCAFGVAPGIRPYHDSDPDIAAQKLQAVLDAAKAYFEVADNTTHHGKTSEQFAMAANFSFIARNKLRAAVEACGD